MNLEQVKKQLSKFNAEKQKVENKKQAKIKELEEKKVEALKVFDDKLAELQKNIKKLETQKAGMEKLLKQLKDMEVSTDDMFSKKEEKTEVVEEENVNVFNSWGNE